MALATIIHRGHADGGVQRRRRARPARRSQLLALMIGLVALALGVPALAGAAAGPSYFGTNLQPLLRDGTIPDARVPDYLAQLQAGQMTVTRFQIDWEYVEPNPPVGGEHTYTWNRQGGLRESVDTTMLEMARKGVRAAPLFLSLPGWAKAPGDAFPASQRGNYAAFIAAFAKRYGPGGQFWSEHPDVPALPTQTYEVWNEVNILPYAWNNTVDAAAYAAVLAAVRPVLKLAQPGAQLLASFAWQGAASYAAALGAAGGLAQLDGVGFHPYAPDAAETLRLVVDLRTQLVASGGGGLPIYVNESGQPVDYNGPGAQFAHAGRPSDGARAAALTYSGDALANSDCNVQQFMNYAITGTESELEPIGEGFMGLMRHGDAQPNVTGAAMQRASRRWVAKSAGPLPPALAICSGGASATQSLLPVGVTVTGSEPGCVTANATYDGNPLESASLVITRWDGSPVPSRPITDAFGNATGCVPSNERGRPFNATVQLGNSGASGTVACDVQTVGCPVGAALSPGSGRVSAAAATKQKLAYLAGGAPTFATAKDWSVATLVARPIRNKKTRKVSIRLKVGFTCVTCEGVAGKKLRLAFSYKRKHVKKERKIKTLTVTVGVTRTITLRVPLRQGDKLILLHRAEASPGIPRLRTQITVRKLRTL